MHKDAIISPCGHYRYMLQRTWDSARGSVCFIMLNPSTADADHDDPTIRRCVAFAKEWGYGQIQVANLFALRATDPRELRAHPSPIGLEADDWIRSLAGSSQLVVCAWGNHGGLHNRSYFVRNVVLKVEDIMPSALRINKAMGEPAHPLYLPKTCRPFVWGWA